MFWFFFWRWLKADRELLPPGNGLFRMAIHEPLKPQFGSRSHFMIQLNSLLVVYLVLFLLRSAWQVSLEILNIAHLRGRGSSVPEEFREVIQAEKLQEICTYTIDSSRFARVSILFDQGFFLAILLSGILPGLVRIFQEWGWGLIPSGLGFFAFLAILSQFVDIPFSLYENFVIEARYGFNTKTLWIWMTDFLKGVFLSALLGGLLVGALLFLVIHGGPGWWIWAWLLVGTVELLILWLYPLLIAPLFNKFEPVENPELVHRIAGLMEKAGLRSKGVFRMNASRRSKHTNAYFTGFGRSKRIVLFDTLLASHTTDEILAILAHEVGHWKRKHVIQQLIFFELFSLFGFYIVSACLQWPLLYRTFGFPENLPYVGLFLAAALFSPVGFFLKPLGAFFSRRFEREADDFALESMPSAAPMIEALKRLAIDNLANLSPHPFYAWVYYSHPPLVERVRRIRRGKKEKSQTDQG
jgi:STE24 endopeptidase